MNVIHNRKKAYQGAVSRASDWILSHQEQDGGFGKVGSLSHYMVLPLTLLYTGHSSTLYRLMPRLKHLFVAKDGSFASYP